MARIFHLFALAAVQAVPCSLVKSGHQIGFTTYYGDYYFNVDQKNLSLTSVEEICNTGVWVTYTGQSYTYGHAWGAIDIYAGLETTCTTSPAYETGSARRVGLLSNPVVASVTLFSDNSLQGEAVAFGGEISEIRFNPQSFVTIDTNVEFFQFPNFEGESVCYEVDLFYCRGVVCWEWNLSYEELPWEAPARSARAGCSFSAKVVGSKVNHTGSATSVTMQL